MKNMIKLLAVVLSILMVLTLLVACAKKQDAPANDASVNEQPAEQTQTPAADEQKPEEAADEGIWKDALYKEDTTLGEGKTTFTFVVSIDESKITFTVNTDKEKLDEALLEVGLIEGDNSEYGLYVKKVNGIVADWSIDGSWWGFFVNGESSNVGVSFIDVEAGAQYGFTYTK